MGRGGIVHGESGGWVVTLAIDFDSSRRDGFASLSPGGSCSPRRDGSDFAQAIELVDVAGDCW